MLRRAALTTIALAAGGAIAALGAGGATAAEGARRPAASPSATAATRSARQARAFARAVNIRGADVPGFIVSAPQHEQESSAEALLAVEFDSCVGAGGYSASLADVSSKSFAREAGEASLDVSSQATVFPSPAVARRELAIAASRRFPTCLARYLNPAAQLLRSNTVKVMPIAVSRLRARAHGTGGTFGWRITLTVAVQGQVISSRTDLLGFRKGSALLALSAEGTPEAFPATSEQRLLALLAKRAGQHRP